MTLADDWLDDVRRYDVLTAAHAFGLTVTGRMFGPCPRCDRESRGTRDKRPPIGIRPDGLGFECQRCHESARGDVVNLAVLVATRGAELRLDRSNAPDVRRACASAGLCEPDPNEYGANGTTKPRPRIVPTPPPPVPRLPLDSVAALWKACRPVTEDPAVCRWLVEERGIDARAVAALDIARALPAHNDLGPWPWARVKGQPWTVRGYRVLVPAYAPDGTLTSLRARAIDPKADPKAAAPTGATIAGLVMANPAALALLAATGTTARAAWIVEGEPDFLALSAQWRDTPAAVFGLFQGAWTDEAAAKIPDGSAVVIATHHDEPGEKYAAQVLASIAQRARAGRLTVQRWRPRT